MLCLAQSPYPFLTVVRTSPLVCSNGLWQAVVIREGSSTASRDGLENIHGMCASRDDRKLGLDSGKSVFVPHRRISLMQSHATFLVAGSATSTEASESGTSAHAGARSPDQYTGLPPHTTLNAGCGSGPYVPLYLRIICERSVTGASTRRQLAYARAGVTADPRSRGAWITQGV